MECNPIHQRAEEFELKYLALSSTSSYTFLIFRTAFDDWEMIDAFYAYMLGLDNEIEDVVLLFTTPFQWEKSYSKSLVEELFMSTFLWNYSEKPREIEENYIDWEMDLDAGSDENVATLFAKNINAFCETVEFEEDSNLVCVLDYQSSNTKGMLHWLKDLAKLDLHPKVRLIISDTFEEPFFDELKHFAPKSTHIIPHRFELAKAIKAVAAMGDPEAPDTKYRYHLVQLYDAINKMNSNAVDQHAAICLKIADENKERDPNWYMQLVLVYCALATCEFGRKQYKAALIPMDEAVATLQEAKGLLPEEIVDSLFGQLCLFRGNLLLMTKDYSKAIDDFKRGESHYAHRQETLMQIEALRLLAVAADKKGDKELRYSALDKGVRLGVNLNETLATSSTYPLLVKAVLESRYVTYISDCQLESIVKPLLGTGWRTKTKSVKNMIVNKD